MALVYAEVYSRRSKNNMLQRRGRWYRQRSRWCSYLSRAIAHPYTFNFSFLETSAYLSISCSFRYFKNFLLLATFFKRLLFASISFGCDARWSCNWVISNVKSAIWTSGDPLSWSCLWNGCTNSRTLSFIAKKNKKIKSYKAIRKYGLPTILYSTQISTKILQKCKGNHKLFVGTDSTYHYPTQDIIHSPNSTNSRKATIIAGKNGISFSVLWWTSILHTRNKSHSPLLTTI